MNTNINKYSERPNANADYIASQKEIITRLYNYLQNTIQLVREYEQEIKKEYNRGFVAGTDREKRGNAPDKFFEREAYRSYSITKLRNEMPNLF